MPHILQQQTGDLQMYDCFSGPSLKLPGGCKELVLENVIYIYEFHSLMAMDSGLFFRK